MANTTYQVSADDHRLRVRLEGRYDLAGLLGVIGSVVGVEGYVPGMDALYDATAAEFAFDAGDVRAFADTAGADFSIWGSDWCFAIAVSSDLMYGLSRMIGAWFEDAPFQVGIFRSLDEAERWIDAGGGDLDVWSTGEA